MQKSYNIRFGTISHLNKHILLDIGIIYVVIILKIINYGFLKAPRGLCACVRIFSFWKMTPLGFLNTYILNLVNFNRFEALLFLLSKSGQSDKMTMPARRAWQFSTRRRAVMLLIIFQSLNYQATPGFCEPWSECQTEGSGLRSAKS